MTRRRKFDFDALDAAWEQVPPPPPPPAPCKVHEPVTATEWHVRTARNDTRAEGAYKVTRCAICGLHLGAVKS